MVLESVEWCADLKCERIAAIVTGCSIGDETAVSPVLR